MENRNYRDKDRYADDRNTPTPHRSYHEKISRDRHGDKYHQEKKGVYASSNNYMDKKKSWEIDTPSRRYRDYDYTPNEKRLKDTPSRSAWEEEENYRSKSKSNWDATPKRQSDRDYPSQRSSRSKYDTP